MDSPAGSSFGKYTLNRLLGEGGMGQVYEAYDTEKNRIVALKILSDGLSNDDTFRKRFQRESHAAAVLQEPHVIPIHDWGEIDGRLFIDMRLVHGDTLSDLIARGPLEPQRAVSIICQVGEALDAAHAEGLIHRDIKPHNIIVTASDFAYLLDFGIAETTGQTRLTEEGMTLGTFHYMAPERFRDQAATPSVDVYALACVLYEALTGQTPFADDKVEVLLAAHLYSPPPLASRANPGVPPALDEVIVRGMAKEPDDRYASAGALGVAASQALGSSAATAPWPTRSGAAATAQSSAPTALWGPAADGPTEQMAKEAGASGTSGQRRKVNWLLVAAVLVVVAAIGVGVGLLMHGSSAPKTPTPSAAPPPAVSSTAPTAVPAASPQAVPPSAPGAARPPLVTGPDNSFKHVVCDEGFTLPGQTGFATHSGRGSHTTGCLLARNVLTEYWAQYGNAGPQPRTVSARGAADCQKVAGAACDGAKFVMQCQQNAGDSWITCTGGFDARVYLW